MIEILFQRREILSSVMQESFGTNRQSDGFALRLHGQIFSDSLSDIKPFDLGTTTEEMTYNGFPEVAYFGFGIGAETNLSEPAIDKFITGVRRLRDRPESGLETLAMDDLALLGIADGIARLLHQHIEIQDLCDWLIPLVEKYPSSKSWSSRARALSGELLDPQSRLNTQPDYSDVDKMALDLALRSIWPTYFNSQETPDIKMQTTLLKQLLIQTPPQVGELDRAAVWLRAIDILVDKTAQSLIPSVSDVARLLQDVQDSLKRWVWRDKSRRKNADPAKWLIDEESDIQSVLWAVLYPIYGSNLVDETYLANCGFVQARADLGILNLKLIIEVKMAREPADFAHFEGQIGEDIGLYFHDINQFDRMIVFVYDDCDHPHPEKYGVFRNAILKRGKEKVEAVVIVRRPSMIPNRNQRSCLPS